MAREARRTDPMTADSMNADPMNAVPMANAGQPQRNKGCKCLRWKGMYIEAEPDPQVPNSDAGIYWCVHTMTCLGPDGEVAAPKSCAAGRGCFEVR